MDRVPDGNGAATVARVLQAFHGLSRQSVLIQATARQRVALASATQLRVARMRRDLSCGKPETILTMTADHRPPVAREHIGDSAPTDIVGAANDVRAPE